MNGILWHLEKDVITYNLRYFEIPLVSVQTIFIDLTVIYVIVLWSIWVLQLPVEILKIAIYCHKSWLWYWEKFIMWFWLSDKLF